MLKVVIKDRCVLKKWLYIYLSIYIIGHHHVKSSFGANNGDNDDVDADAGDDAAADDDDDDVDDQDRVRLYTLGTPQHQLWPRPTSC